MRAHTEYESVQRTQVIALAAACGTPFIGSYTPSILFLKAEFAEATSAEKILGIEEKDALEKSLIALELGADCYAAAIVNSDTPIAEFRVLLETLDPSQVVLLDKTAARYVALILDTAAFALDTPNFVQGRTFIALEGFEASLQDDKAKRREWVRLKLLASTRKY